MKQVQPRPLANHLEEVIDIWFEFNRNNITKKGVEALKDTVSLTIINYYKDM